MKTTTQHQLIEVWKDIEGYDGKYQISNFGNIRSMTTILKHKSGTDGRRQYSRMVQGGVLKQAISYRGYCMVSLWKDGRAKRSLIHRLVALAFVENPSNSPEVNHKNAIKTDNRVENWEWCTRLENLKHAKSLGLSRAKITEDDVLFIRTMYWMYGISQNDLSKEYTGIKRCTINQIVHFKTWPNIHQL